MAPVCRHALDPTVDPVVAVVVAAEEVALARNALRVIVARAPTDHAMIGPVMIGGRVLARAMVDRRRVNVLPVHLSSDE